jgi:hypothetical protein
VREFLIERNGQVTVPPHASCGWTTPRRSAICPNVLSAPTFPELDEVLAKLDAKLDAREVHALYLGAITSTRFQLGPQRLLDRIFGDQPSLGDSVEDANKNLQVLFGYWNTLLSERKAGRLGLAPARLPTKPTMENLVDYARRRHEELLWYIRGIDAGGDDPMEFGAEGKKLLEGIARVPPSTARRRSRPASVPPPGLVRRPCRSTWRSRA